MEEQISYVILYTIMVDKLYRPIIESVQVSYKNNTSLLNNHAGQTSKNQ